MLDRIIRFSIKNKIFIFVCTFLLIVWGIWSAGKIPIDAVPDITNNQVQIYTNCPSLAGQEVERLVTFPIEQSVANIPDIDEVRSISRFGLSVITVVFKDNVDIYFARQLINERLQEAVEAIPPGTGTPEMAPVSTGLGEIYQYIIHPKPGSEDKYSNSDLRTMQDWIVARQLLGTPGIAEVNSFGGELKQYEVAVNTERLRSMDIGIPDIFEALEKNNQNTGGAYIDKRPNAYFIRGIGLVTGIEDIRMIPVKTRGNVPIFIKDVADVRIGHAVRYGALTYNGEVDAVGGVVMMLKGENSHDVVRRIKEKMPVIQRSLPDDVIIEPYLDRNDLISRTIATVEKNLIEGALIVIFVLVVFLGNIRAGLIVASAIPLSMLFALGMMNVFGVSANLMSLGAIDFGLIVDGAVIVVEASMHHLGLRKSRHRLTQAEMDEEVAESASKIRKSAAFGELIILIVYIPILTLSGIEGKMFKPMAQTVSFAILGALILSMTYIPMMSALFLPKAAMVKETFSDKMMNFFNSIYQPILKKAIRIKYLLVALTVLVFAGSLVIFKNLGGEFIPQLQEGDFAYHCILPQGSSLQQSIETSMHASRIIREFDEVKMVIGKTGSAEVPTDPMPPEITDLIIVLKPIKEWPIKRSYAELSEAIMERLEILPGIFFESNQPIQMRFNELMTGIRQDVAVKIFGENLDTLEYYANKVSDVARNIEGISTPQVERLSGLPEINIEYNRVKLANYNLNISEVNDIVSTAFAGKKAGVVYEDERRFDLVVRLDSTHRSDIVDVRNLLIPLSTGSQIPLSQVADIDYKLGPAQISRESGKRRIVIGFNVTDRDVKSVVNEIQEELDRKVQLPVGYYFSYGGQFENLEKATARLLVAVPASLLLIFILLYFTFHSFKQAILIFTAIPMSAIGGILALMLRDMHFSISASIGFIALFGVAVLNGIVLIGTFNQLEKEGETHIIKRVLKGTHIRLRPVLMTATVASLGFLPMALSTSAGAEVQKPLATVVIGGLTTATFLTLIVLPLLYIIFYSHIDFSMKNKNRLSVIILIFGTTFLASNINGQTRISLDQAIETAWHQNLQLKVSDSDVRQAEAQIKTSSEFPNTELFVENEELHPSDPKGILKIGLSQSIAWPGLYSANKKLNRELLKYREYNSDLARSIIKKQVSLSYYNLWYLENKKELFKQLDTIYSDLYKAAELRVKTGSSTPLDRISAQARYEELQAILNQNDREISIEQHRLMTLLNSQETVLPLDKSLEKLAPELASSASSHPLISVQQQNINVSEAEINIRKNQNRPEFSGRFYSQRLWGAKDPYSGFSISAGFPLLGLSAAKHKVEVAKIEKEKQINILDYQVQELNNERHIAESEMLQHLSLLDYYENSGLKHSDDIIAAGTLSYKSGEISFAELSQFLSQVIEIKQNYLDVLNLYNQSVLKLNYYNNR